LKPPWIAEAAFSRRGCLETPFAIHGCPEAATPSSTHHSGALGLIAAGVVVKRIESADAIKHASRNPMAKTLPRPRDAPVANTCFMHSSQDKQIAADHGNPEIS
jgi:hypothetical protein